MRLTGLPTDNFDWQSVTVIGDYNQVDNACKAVKTSGALVRSK